MKLNDKQKAMLDGGYGMPVQTAMEMLCAIGRIYGADALIPVKSAHCAGLSYKSHGKAGMKWAEQMASLGARTVVPTTMNVIGVDRSRDLGLPKEWVQCQMRIEKAYEAMGCMGTSSCVPYFYSSLPKFGEHVAWAESSAIVFINSVIGARNNREGGLSAWASAITGYTPYFGLHIKKNRAGDILFRITTELSKSSDYGALGNYVGKMIGERIPVFEGMKSPSTEDLVTLGAALASAGCVAMFHAVGVTPEARTIDEAFQGKQYEIVEIGKKEILQGYQNLTSAAKEQVDYVAIGCPHCSLAQVAEIAAMLEGKHVNPGTTLWIHTNIAVKAMAKELGYEKTIEQAGGVLTQDLCTVLSCPETLGFTTLATNSPKMAFYAPGGNQLPTWYGCLEQCIQAAVNGYWN